MPARHGFHFENEFVSHVGVITTYGLCGGMVLAAARYWKQRLPIPTHRAGDFESGARVPAEGSRLQRYIYGCQMESFGPLNFISALNWITAVGFDEQFGWCLGEFDRIRAEIDRGNPVVIGLRVREPGNPFGHQMLAIGYDVSPKRIYVYDPNFADFESTLTLDEPAKRIRQTTPPGRSLAHEWSSLFITGCAIGDQRPDYIDISLESGFVVEPLPTRVRQPIGVSVTVRNFGDYPARLSELFIYARGPDGGNRDDLLGGGDHDATPIPAGGTRRLTRRNASFAEAPGSYLVGISYRSDRDQWIPIPVMVGGTRAEVRVDVLPATSQSVPNWFSLGGIITAPPTVIANADSRLEVFVRGADNKMYHLFQRTPNVPNDCSGFELLGGDQTFRGAASAVLNNWNKIEIFACGRDNALWHRWQNDPNVREANRWSPWGPLGGWLAADPTAVLNGDKRIEVFAVHEGGRVHHIYQRWFDLFGAPWSGWEPLDGRLFKGRVAADRDAAGRIHVIARDQGDDAMWVNFQTTPGGAWSGWVAFGGVAASDPTLSRNADGRLEAFVRGTNGRVFHKWQIAPNGNWSNWAPLVEGSPTAPVLFGEARPTAILDRRGQLEIFARASDSSVSTTRETGGSPPWTDFRTIGPTVTSDVATGVNPGGVVELFAVGPNRELLHHWFTP
ncbi:Putative membrane protein [Minicystis rosea]|nr:Putative membrane protein [Minicystis rosea]